MEVKSLSLDLIDIPETGPRTFVTKEKLQELADSIKTIGVRQPIEVAKEKDRYRLIFGQRRYMASKMAGKTTIPAIIRASDDKTNDIAILHENINREDLNTLDIANYLRYLKEKKRLGTTDIAKMFNKSISWVSTHLRLLETPQTIQAAVESGKIDLTSALELSRVPKPMRREALLRSAVLSGASQGTIRTWVADELRSAGLKPSPEPTPSGSGEVSKPEPLVFDCPLCLRTLDQNKAMTMLICHDCQPLLRKIIKATIGDQENGIKSWENTGPDHKSK